MTYYKHIEGRAIPQRSRWRDKMAIFTHEETKIINRAKQILLDKSRKSQAPFESPQVLKDFLRLECAALEHEIFGVVMLDTKHRLIAIEKLFTGTIDGASIHMREVVKTLLSNNAAACVVFHNHPSGDFSPSQADKFLTEKLKEALALVDVRLLDHFIVGLEGEFSFVENGLL